MSSYLSHGHYRARPLPAGLGLLGGDLPYFPKFDILITRAADNYVALGAESRVEYTRIMRVTNLSDFVERGVRVHHDRIVREAMRGEELFCKRGELNRGDLCGCGERVESCARVRIPKVHGRVSSSTTGGQKGSLPWAPGEGLLDIRQTHVSGMHPGMRKEKRLILL